MEKIEKTSKAKKTKKSKTVKPKRKISFALKFILIIFLLCLAAYAGYYVSEKKLLEKKQTRIISKEEKEEITFENKELLDAFAYSFDENNIYAVYKDNQTKKIYGFDSNKEYITSLIYKEGMLYFTILNEEKNTDVKAIDLNKGNGKYDVENLDISYKQLSLLGCYDKYIYYYKSYSAVYDNEEYGYQLYKYDIDTTEETIAIEGLVSSAQISENGKIYYTKSYAKSLNNKTKIIKSNIYSYNVSDDKNLLITSLKYNDYYGNVIPFEIKKIYKNYMIYSYDTRDKTYYYRYDINTTQITKILEEPRYSIECDNDNNYLICLKTVKDNKKDLLVYSVETIEKIYESNNVTDKDLQNAYVLPSSDFTLLYINLGPDDTTNIYDLIQQEFKEENAKHLTTVLKYE